MRAQSFHEPSPLRIDIEKHSNTFDEVLIAYELALHRMLGGGSCTFKTDYASYLKTLLAPRSNWTEVNILFQPNSSPRVGTLRSLGVAFAVARRLQDLGVETIVRCDLWDQTKGEEHEIGEVKYQRSLQDTGGF